MSLLRLMQSLSLLAFVGGTVLGLTVGSGITGFICLERRPHPWSIVLRLPPHLYDRLRQSARVNSRGLGAEIVKRLEEAMP